MPDKYPLIWKTALGTLCVMPMLLVATRAGADIGACLIAALFMIHSRINNDWRWVRQPEILVLLALWGFMVAVSWLTPMDRVGSFKASLIWGRFVLFYAAMRFWLLQHPASLGALGKIGAGIFAFVVIDTLWQYNTGISLSGRDMISDRLTGALSNANIGNYLLKTGLPVVGLLTYQAMAEGKRRRLWIPAAMLLTIISIVTVSGERSTAVLMLLALAVIGMALFIFLPQARRLVLSGAAVITALLAWLWATQEIVHGKVLFFAEQMADFWNTPYGQLYTAAAKLWQQYPLTGIGPKQFLEACKPEILNVTYCDVHPHNMYVEWLVATGLPGTALFLAAMALILRHLFRSAAWAGHASILTAFAFSQFAVMLFPFVVTQSVFSNWPGILFWYSLGLGMSLMNMARREGTHEQHA